MRLFQVDAFADRVFAGNPAAVCLLGGPAGTRWMQSVAGEMNLSETAFVEPQAAGYGLRWFTPVAEVGLCGHATLASAHVLGRDKTSFATLSGVLTATAAEDGWYTLDFPTAPLSPMAAPPWLAGVLGAEIVSVHHTGPNTDDLLVEVADEATVRGLRPDLSALATRENRGVIVTAVAADPAGGHDFVSRFFGAAAGVGEDPVTGSAHTALTPFWSARIGRTSLTGYQASRRGGFVRVALAGDRTHLTGKAVTVIDGELLA